MAQIQPNTPGDNRDHFGSSDNKHFEPARFTLVGPKCDPSNELVRWLLEQRQILYREKPSIPVLGAFVFRWTFVFRWNRIGRDSPLLITPDGSHRGIVASLHAIDRICHPGERVYGDTEEERAANQIWWELFQDKLSKQAIRVHYSIALQHKDIVKKHASQRAPLWQRLLLSIFCSPWTKLLRKALELNRFQTNADVAAVDSVFDSVENQISDESPFLGGKSPGFADIAFACFASPLMLPSGLGTQLPDDSELPEEIRDRVIQNQQRPAGQLVQKIYRSCRPEPQPPLKTRQAYAFVSRPPPPRLLRLAATLRVKFLPTFRFGGRLYLSRWKDVTEVLSKDCDFRIEPINGKKIKDVNGPFILGMDRQPEMFMQRERIYRALHRMDCSAIHSIVDTESKRVLQLALQSGRLDVINGYARLVAVRTATSLFGRVGPTEQDLLRVLRALFHQTFLNPKNDPLVHARGQRAARQFQNWADKEIKGRRLSGDVGEDVLGHLIAMSQGDDPSLPRRMLGGMIVGAVDTTTTAVGNIVSELLSCRHLRNAMQAERHDSSRLHGWCWEALRRRPLSPAMLREASRQVSVGGSSVDKETLIVLSTLGAMHDSAAFPRPAAMDPRRPLDRYLHFGHGIHQCVGRDINAIQIPLLVKNLLDYDIAQVRAVRYSGPFPDSLIVSMNRLSPCMNS
ncbi:MAG: cytochrome P450 [Planctomycetota bacterium]